MRSVRFFTSLLVFLATGGLQAAEKSALPALYLVGDSTVHSTGDVAGWGDVFAAEFDLSRIAVFNCAYPGRSTRSFRNDGRWAEVLRRLHPGDYVFIQFGHNDQADIERKEKVGRGTLPGLGDETVETHNTSDGRPETVHTYGWYLTQYIREAKAAGAVVVVFAPVPRTYWNPDGSFRHVMRPHADWAQAVARREQVRFVDLEALLSRQYEAMGREETKRLLPGGTHTTLEGARFVSHQVVAGLKALGDLPLPYK